MTKDQLRSLLEYLGVQQLTERPHDYTGCCLLHGERRPSWGISHAKPGHPWSCFSCGASGRSVISLVQAVQDVRRQEAEHITFRFGHVDIVDMDFSVKPDSPIPAEYYYMAYPPLEEFRGYSKEFLMAMCLRKSPAGVIVPYYIDGTFLGYIEYFPGNERRIDPKYGFRFKQHLFVPRPDRLRDKPLILVEGFTDALRVWSYSYRNVAAIGGTSFSAAQKEEVLRMDPPSVVCMFDADSGGTAAFENVRRRISEVPVFKAASYGAKDPDLMSPAGFRNAWTNKALVLA